jgi:hypothetical protein
MNEGGKRCFFLSFFLIYVYVMYQGVKTIDPTGRPLRAIFDAR